MKIWDFNEKFTIIKRERIQTDLKHHCHLLMNNVTLAHIGGELVIIGGVAFYFHRKVTNQQKQIDELTQVCANLQQENEELHNSLNQLGAMVMQMHQNMNLGNPMSRGGPPQMGNGSGGGPVQRRPPQSGTSPISGVVRKPRPSGAQPAQSPIQTQRRPKAPAQPTFRPSRGRVEPVENSGDDSGDQTYDDQILDAELGSELEGLNCDGDVCTLVDE